MIIAKTIFLLLSMIGVLQALDEEPAAIKPFKLVDIRYIGVKGLSKDQIKQSLNLKKNTVYDQYLFMYLLNIDLQRIELTYRQNGFYSAKASWSVEFVGGNDEKRVLTVNVTEGKRAIISKISINGSLTDEQKKMLIPVTLLEIGGPYKSSLIHQGKVLLQEELGSWGYPYAVVESQTTFSNDFTQVEVSYIIETNELMSIDKITIDHTGNLQKLDDETVRHYTTFRSGQRYNLDEVYETRRRLFSTGFLDDVRIITKKSEKPGFVDIQIVIREGKPRQWQVIPGFASPDRAKASAEWRHFNLLGHAEQFTVGANTSYAVTSEEYSYGCDINYIVPFVLGFPPTWFLTPYYDYSYSRQYYKEIIPQQPLSPKSETAVKKLENYYVTERGGIDTSLKHILDRFWTLKEGVKIELVNVMNYIESNDSIKSTGEPSYEGKEWVNTVRVVGVLSRDNRMNKFGAYDSFNPTDGSYGYGGGELAGGVLGGDYDFYKANFDVSRYQPVAEGSVLGLHFRSAVAIPYGRNTVVPYWERLYAGGGYSVRGIRDNRMGPLKADGTAFGGEFLAYGNLELRAPLFGKSSRLLGIDLEPLWAGIFFDTGELVTKISDMNPEKIQSGIGFGLRYNTIVGPVRVDFAKEVTTDEPLQFYLALGHCF